MADLRAFSFPDLQRRFSDLDHVPVGLTVLDREFRILFWNQAMEQLTGFQKTAAEGHLMSQLNREWILSSYAEQLEPLFKDGSPVIFPSLLHRKIVAERQEVRRSFQVKATAVPDDEGGWWALLSVEDVTVLWHQVEELRDLNAQQERMMREIHHRVKNNLNMISGLITLQKSRIESAPENSLLDDLQSRIVAISEIHDVLYRSASLTTAGTGDYLAGLAQLLNKNLSLSENHRLILDFDSDIVLKTDTTVLLGMVQAELLTNALKYGLGREESQILSISLVRRGPKDYEYRLSHSGDRLPENFDPKTSVGLGMVLLTAYADQLGSQLEWEKGDPTRFWLRFSEE